MSDDKEGQDASDWLANQFNPTELVPQQPAAAQPPVAESPVAESPVVQSVEPAQASAPPSDASAFDWLLQNGSAPSAPAAPVPSAPAPSPSVPSAPTYGAPTEPYTPVGDPTMPLSWDEFAASQQAPTSSAPSAPTAGQVPPTYLDEPTQAFTMPPWEPAASGSVYPTAPTTPFGDRLADDQPANDPTSAIDSLFGDHQFQAYEEVGVLQAVQSVPGRGESEPKPPRAPLSQMQKTLMGVAGGLIGVLILIAMYFLGQHIGAAQAATPTASATGSSTKAPTSAGTGGPASPGVQPWSALQGGECITNFTSAWAATFTVVDCTSDHTAEMVFKGNLPDAAGTTYPTTTQFQTELTGLCSAPTALNYATAKAVTDLQVSFSYPATSAKWDAGNRTYYCFVDRQSGSNLTGDLSVPKTGN